MYIMYIVVHTVCDMFCTGCPMHSCIRNGDMNQDAKVGQKTICAYVYIHLKYTHGCVCTIRYALLGQCRGSLIKAQSCITVV